MPWTLEERYKRNILVDDTVDDDGKIAEIGPDSLEIRSLMVDVARNFHSLETLKVNTNKIFRL
jgi:hypothetical protein